VLTQSSNKPNLAERFGAQPRDNTAGFFMAGPSHDHRHLDLTF
jgi:hypothetical protein